MLASSIRNHLVTWWQEICATGTPGHPPRPAPRTRLECEQLEDRLVPSGIMPGTRHPADWPFDRYSPWNMPIGSGAVYQTLNSPGITVNSGGWIATRDWTIPVYKATNSDPLRTIFFNGQSRGQYRVPDAATPAGPNQSGTDGHLVIITPDGRSSIEMWRASRRANGDLDCSSFDIYSLTGTGWNQYPGGPRAYGGSALGGLIRQYDITGGDRLIHHALAVSVPRYAMSKLGPNGQTWVWPATISDDGGQANGYNTDPSCNLFMGSLVAIPRTVDLVNTVGLTPGSWSYRMAKALQDYGAYVVDASGGGTWNFYADATIPLNLLPVQWSQFNVEFNRALTYLKVVANNGPSTPGGGGIPVVDLAPDWAGALAQTTTVVTASANPSRFGQPVTFTATVSSGTAGTITGTVTFKDGSTTLGTSVVSGGRATFSTSTLSVGSHSITALYSGDASYAASTSPVFVETIEQALSSIALTTSAASSTFGQAVTFTATVSSSAGTPTGTVTFRAGSTTLGTATLSGGRASFTTSSLAAGTHTITAVYNGSTNIAGSTSTALTQTVAKAASSTTLTTSAASVQVGQPVTFTATVNSSAGTPTGTVTFRAGSTTLGTATLSGGRASFTTSSLAVGSHAISAIYGGSSNYNGSTSAALTQTISQASSSTVLTASATTVQAGQPVTFSATVRSSAGTPTGTVTFKDGSTTLGTVTLSGGVANLTASSLAVGSHAITAIFNGSTTIAASTSAVLTLTVTSVPSAGPIAHWRLDGDGSDASGNGKTLTLANGPTFTTGKTGSALTLNGSNQYGVTAAPLIDTTRSFTVSAWVLWNGASGWRSIITQDGQNISGFWLEKRDDNRLVFERDSSDSTGSTATFAAAPSAMTANTWYHVVGVYDSAAGQIQLYLNGTLAATAAFTTPWAATGPLAVGRGKWGSPTDYWAGKIDEVRIYQRALTAAEVQSLYTGGLNYSTGFAGATGLTLNGSAAVSGSALRLTSGATNQAGSAFSSNKVTITRFSTSFDFQLTNPNADGFTFTLQGGSPTALGGSSGGLGYAGIAQSLAIKFDLYNNGGEGINSTGLYLNGAAPYGNAVNLTGSGIDLHSGHTFNVRIDYDGTTLRVTITDRVTGASAVQSYTVNIASVVGGSTAYVGFTGGTGGLTATQDILNWTFDPLV
jgi:hypothetical protein